MNKPRGLAAFDLSGKVAAVTGGNRGLGRAIAIALAEAGASVAILARDEARSAETLADLKKIGAPAIARRLDVTDRKSLQPALIEVERQLGPLDIFVNNSAIAILKSVLDQSAEEWDLVIETNLNSCFLLSKYAAQSMIQRKRGKIINVSSIGGNLGTPIYPSYGVAKAGLQQLTRCLALELAPFNIQVNSILPGWFTTDMTEWVRKDPKYADVLRLSLERSPIGRFGEPQELGGAAVFLASSASDHVTGIELVVDAGFSA